MRAVSFAFYAPALLGRSDIVLLGRAVQKLSWLFDISKCGDAILLTRVPNWSALIGLGEALPALAVGLADAVIYWLRLMRRFGSMPTTRAALVMLASATLHTLAIRSRAGASRSTLEAMADATVHLICGPPSHRIRKRSIRTTG